MTTTELSAETRAHILDAAWQRVREHGPASISVRAIANDAGVSRQLVYFHYGNRAGLLNALAHRVLGSPSIALAAVRDDDSFEELTADTAESCTGPAHAAFESPNILGTHNDNC